MTKTQIKDFFSDNTYYTTCKKLKNPELFQSIYAQVLSKVSQNVDIHFDLNENKIKFSKKFIKNLNNADKDLDTFYKLSKNITAYQHIRIINDLSRYLFSDSYQNFTITLFDIENLNMSVYMRNLKDSQEFLSKYIDLMQAISFAVVWEDIDTNEIMVQKSLTNGITSFLTLQEKTEIFSKVYKQDNVYCDTKYIICDTEKDYFDLDKEDPDKKCIADLQEFHSILNVFTDKEILEAALPVLRKKLNEKREKELKKLSKDK
jgi:hypothetical protein